MGIAIERDRFEEHEYARFQERLRGGLQALEQLLARPDFGVGPPSLGAELEVALVGEDGRPRPVNLEVLRETLDPRMTVELDRFNLECNLRHTCLAGRPFTHLAGELSDAVAELDRAAVRHRARVAMVGILPTLCAEDLQSDAMTDTPRFRALSHALQRERLEPFAVRIHGDDPLEVQCDDVTFEGAATSLQLHLRVSPADFARTFNAAQLATAPVLAAAGNSPIFLGHRLWHETRVALFKQAVDARGGEGARRRKPRVCFGADWNREGALEIFREAVADFTPLLPVLDDQDPMACLAAGEVPRLGEIRLHQGTVWSWNRPVYDPADGGHLRIELRALPAGPSIADMVANAAFLVGLILGLSREVSRWDALSFAAAHDAFYRAAQHGLAAAIDWPAGTSAPAGVRPARELVPALLPIAARGLSEAGVDAREIDAQLEIIARRCETGRTGAVWQREALDGFAGDGSRDAALQHMFVRYLRHSRSGDPVHAWPSPC